MSVWWWCQHQILLRMMAVFLLTVLCGIGLFVFVIGAAPQRVAMRDRIEYGLDLHPGLQPTWKLTLSRKLFNMRSIAKPEEFLPTFEVVGHADWANLMTMYKKANISAPGLLPNDRTIIETFDNKIAWKAWMHKNGLGDHVPRAFNIHDDPKTFEYPMVLKTNQHFGQGVYVVHGPDDLRNLSSSFEAQKVEFMLEEALTGLGFREVYAWGSAYKGRLLSLRCMVHSYNPHKAVSGAYRNSSHATESVKKSGIDSSVPFVRGFMLMANKEEYFPCSKEFVSLQTAMIQASGYSGSLCSQTKLDNHKRIKILEVNTRFCGSLRFRDELFLLSYVPLAFAMVEADPVLHASLRRKLFEGAHNRTFQAIAANETRALQTGGGWYKDQWLELEKFNADLRIDHVTYHAA